MTKSPINWYGGKYYMKNKICDIIKDADAKLMVDVFGGSGIIALNCSNEIIVYNDIHEGLYLLFKILRDENTRQLLIDKIQLTPYSRKEFWDCKLTWKDEKNEIEKARKFYTVTMQSIGSSGINWSAQKKSVRRGMSLSVSRWLGNVDKNLVEVIEKLREIQIENLDAIALIKKYDSIDAVFYLDPPYIKSTRKATDIYQYEMSDEQHKILVNTLLTLKGKAILSGYEHEIYEILEESGWHKIFLGEYSKGFQSLAEEPLEKGREFLWINFNLPSVILNDSFDIDNMN